MCNTKINHHMGVFKLWRQNMKEEKINEEALEELSNNKGEKEDE